MVVESEPCLECGNGKFYVKARGETCTFCGYPSELLRRIVTLELERNNARGVAKAWRGYAVAIGPRPGGDADWDELPWEEGPD